GVLAGRSCAATTLHLRSRFVCDDHAVCTHKYASGAGRRHGPRNRRAGAQPSLSHYSPHSRKAPEDNAGGSGVTSWSWCKAGQLTALYLSLCTYNPSAVKKTSAIQTRENTISRSLLKGSW